MLLTTFGEAFSTLKEALVKLTLGQSPVHIWELFEKITDWLILGPDILRIYNAFVDFRRHLLRPEEEEVSSSSPGCPVLLWPPTM